MDIIQIVGIGVVSTVIIVILKAQRPETGIWVTITAGTLIFLLIAGKLAAVIELLKSYADKANINTVYVTTLLKIIGIAYIAEFGAELCKDAGESAIASKIELAGKVLIIVLAMPVMTSLLDLVIHIMP